MVMNAPSTMASFAPSVISILFLRARRVAVVDLAAAALQPPVAEEAVLVERRLLQYALGLEEVGASAHGVEAPEDAPLEPLGVHPFGVVPARVDRAGRRVAQRRGAEQRQHQIRPG